MNHLTSEDAPCRSLLDDLARRVRMFVVQHRWEDAERLLLQELTLGFDDPLVLALRAYVRVSREDLPRHERIHQARLGERLVAFFDPSPAAMRVLEQVALQREALLSAPPFLAAPTAIAES